MQASRNGVAVAPPQHWATFMEDEGVELREQVPLAPYTTLGLGGEARYFVECGSEDEVRAALAYAAERRLPAYVLGGGSNVVFLDSGFPGLILRLTIGGMDLRDGPSPEVRAGAGVDWDTLVQNVVQRGWTGVECLSGIPGTVGGTPIQNVGAYGQEIAESLVSVECLDRATLERRTFTARECAFGYRDSRFKRADRGRYVVLEVTLRLAPAVARSEEHTSELQSPCNLVCRLLLEKKKRNAKYHTVSKRRRYAQRSDFVRA